MKLIVVLLLAVAVVLSGCASRDAGQKTIVVGIQSDIFTTQAYTNARKRFEAAHPGVQLKEMVVTGGGYYQKMQTMFAGDSEPDVMWMGMGFGDFAAKGVLEDLTPYIKGDRCDITKSLDKYVVSAYARYGGQYGLPFGVDFQILYYNKDMFDKAGLAYPNSKWTKEDLLNAARKLTVFKGRSRPEVYGLAGAIQMCSFGARCISDDGKKVLVNSPETAQYMIYGRDLVKKYRVTPAQTTSQLMGMNEAMMFCTGRTAMLASFNSDLPTILRSSRVRWGMCVTPYMGGKGRSLWASTSGFCMSKRSKNKKLAWELIKTYISPEFMKDYYPSTIPVDINCLKHVLKSDNKLPSGAYETVLESMNYLYIEPRTKGIFERQNAFNMATERFGETKSSPGPMLKDAAKRMAKLVEK